MVGYEYALFSIVQPLTQEWELVFEFFTVFSRFEYALKRSAISEVMVTGSSQTGTDLLIRCTGASLQSKMIRFKRRFFI